MTAEQKVRYTIGELVLQNLALDAANEELRNQLSILTQQVKALTDVPPPSNPESNV